MSPWDELESIRVAAVERILPDRRKRLGQVLTPMPVARLLGSSSQIGAVTWTSSTAALELAR